MPLPSDDTTPPVTQMNLVMGATVAGEARREGSLADRGVVPPLEFGRFPDRNGASSVPSEAPRRLTGLRSEFCGYAQVRHRHETVIGVEQQGQHSAPPWQHLVFLQPLAQLAPMCATGGLEHLAAPAPPDRQTVRQALPTQSDARICDQFE